MEKLNTGGHWTSKSVEDFTYRIASDFIAQIENSNDKNGITKSDLAVRLQRTLGRISQLFNPGNMNLSSAVKVGQASGMKVALVAYDDNDPQNQNGPINSEIFYQCWRAMGAPKNFFELADLLVPVEFRGWEKEAANYGETLRVLAPQVSASTRTGHRASAIN
jgi:hypothetical protein